MTINFSKQTFYDTNAVGHPQPSDPYINADFFNARENLFQALVEASNAVDGKITTALSGVSETARDAVGAALVAGSNVSIVPDDTANTITISVSSPAVTQYTDEQAQDAFGALIAAGTHAGIAFNYNDAGNALSATVSAQSWSQITGKPTFATVATSGSYNDLTNKPTIPSQAADVGAQPVDADLTSIAALDSATSGTIASDGSGWIKKTYAQFKAALGLSAVATSGDYNDLANKPVISGAPADATTTSKGIVQLAGDLAGTAVNPTVPALLTKAPLPTDSKNPLTGLYHTSGFGSVQSAIDAAAAGAGKGEVFVTASVTITSSLVLPSTVNVSIKCAPEAVITAGSTMSSMIYKASGFVSDIALTSVNLDANRLADRCIDIEQAHRLTIKGGQWSNALVCVADFGRQGGQVYEMSWRDTRVRGLDSARSGATPSQRATYGYRFGSNTTDNVVDNVVVANAASVGVIDGGGGNIHRSVHAFGYPYQTSTNTNEYAPAIGFQCTGGMNRFVDCYADTALIGFDIQGSSVSVVNPIFYYPADWTYTGDIIGININGNDCTIIGATFRSATGLTGYPIRIQTGITLTLVVGLNIYGSGWKAAWQLIGTASAPIVSGALWDGGAISTNQEIGGPSSSNRDLFFSTKGGSTPNKRWAWRVNSDAENGNSQGSNLQLISYLDNGNFGFNIVQLNRNSGIWVNQRATQKVRSAQTLASNGAISIDSAISSYHRILLQANATSSSISNSSVVSGGSTSPQSGQELTIAWIQDATGGKTYTWPTNCRFASNTAPADTTSNRLTSVTFVYDSSNSVWIEQARAVSVPIS